MSERLVVFFEQERSCADALRVLRIQLLVGARHTPLSTSITKSSVDSNSISPSDSGVLLVPSGLLGRYLESLEGASEIVALPDALPLLTTLAAGLGPESGLDLMQERPLHRRLSHPVAVLETRDERRGAM